MRQHDANLNLYLIWCDNDNSEADDDDKDDYDLVVKPVCGGENPSQGGNKRKKKKPAKYVYERTWKKLIIFFLAAYKH